MAFSDRGLPAHGNAIRVASQDQFVVCNKLVHVGNGHLLVHNDIFFVQRLSLGDLKVAERDDIRLGILQE